MKLLESSSKKRKTKICPIVIDINKKYYIVNPIESLNIFSVFENNEENYNTKIINKMLIYRTVNINIQKLIYDFINNMSNELYNLLVPNFIFHLRDNTIILNMEPEYFKLLVYKMLVDDREVGDDKDFNCRDINKVIKLFKGVQLEDNLDINKYKHHLVESEDEEIVCSNFIEKLRNLFK